VTKSLVYTRPYKPVTKGVIVYESVQPAGVDAGAFGATSATMYVSPSFAAGSAMRSLFASPKLILFGASIGEELELLDTDDDSVLLVLYELVELLLIVLDVDSDDRLEVELLDCELDDSVEVELLVDTDDPDDSDV